MLDPSWSQIRPEHSTYMVYHWITERKWRLFSRVQLCNPMDCSLSGSSVHGILQARILEWVAISFSKGSSWPRDWTWISSTSGRLFTVWATRKAKKIILTPIIAKVPLSIEFSRQESWSGLPCRPPGDIPNPGIEPRSHIAGRFTVWATREAQRTQSNAGETCVECWKMGDSLLIWTLWEETKTSKAYLTSLLMLRTNLSEISTPLFSFN